MKKIFSILTALALCLALLPASVFAEGTEEYPLWVGGVQATSENASDILGDGTAVYDPENFTLKLNGLSLVNRGVLWENANGFRESGIKWANENALTIELTGSNSIVMADRHDERISEGIFAGEVLYITGSGDLTVKGGNTYNRSSIGIYMNGYLHLTGDFTGCLSVFGGDHHAENNASSFGIYAKIVYCHGGELYARGGGAYTLGDYNNASSYGIYTTNHVEVYGGSVTAIGGTTSSNDSSTSCGIYARDTISVYTGTMIGCGGTAFGGDIDGDGTVRSYGIWSAFEQYGGTVIAQGGSASQHSPFGNAESFGLSYKATIDFDQAYELGARPGGLFISKAGPVNGSYAFARESDDFLMRAAVNGSLHLEENTRIAAASVWSDLEAQEWFGLIDEIVLDNENAGGSLNETIYYCGDYAVLPMGIVVCDEGKTVTNSLPGGDRLSEDVCVVTAQSSEHFHSEKKDLILNDHDLILADLSERAEGDCVLEFGDPVNVQGPGSFTAVSGVSLDGNSEALFFDEGASVLGERTKMTVCGERSVGPDGCVIGFSAIDGSCVRLVSYADDPYPNGSPALTCSGEAAAYMPDEHFQLASSAVIPRPLLTVGGIEVWENDEPVDIMGDGSAVYDPFMSTLTLTDFDLNKVRGRSLNSENDEFGIAWQSPDALYIELVGSNNIKLGEAAEGKRSIGIYSLGTLYFVGAGSIRVSAGDTVGADSFGLYGEDEVRFYLDPEGSAVISGGTAWAGSGETVMSCGLWANAVNFNNGRVICAGGDVISSPDDPAVLCGSYGVFSVNDVYNYCCLSALGGTAEGGENLVSTGINIGRSDSSVYCQTGILIAKGGCADGRNAGCRFASAAGVSGHLSMYGGLAFCEGGSVYGEVADGYVYSTGAMLGVDAEMYADNSVLMLRAGTVNGSYDTLLSSANVPSRAAAYSLRLGENAYAAFASAWTSRNAQNGELAEAYLLNGHQEMGEIEVSVRDIDSLNGRPIYPVGLLITSSDVSPALRSSSPDYLDRSMWYAGIVDDEPLITAEREDISLNGHTLIVADFSEQQDGCSSAVYAEQSLDIIGPGTLIAVGGNSLRGNNVGLTASRDIDLYEATLICGGTMGCVCEDPEGSVNVSPDSLALFYGSNNWGDTLYDEGNGAAEYPPYVVAMIHMNKEAGLLGDVNGDNEVDAKDLTVLARHVARIQLLDDEAALLNADVNLDGVIDAKDLTKLARYVAKIIPSLED